MQIPVPSVVFAVYISHPFDFDCAQIAEHSSVESPYGEVKCGFQSLKLRVLVYGSVVEHKGVWSRLPAGWISGTTVLLEHMPNYI